MMDSREAELEKLMNLGGNCHIANGSHDSQGRGKEWD